MNFTEMFRYKKLSYCWQIAHFNISHGKVNSLLREGEKLRVVSTQYSLDGHCMHHGMDHVHYTQRCVAVDKKNKVKNSPTCHTCLDGKFTASHCWLLCDTLNDKRDPCNCLFLKLISSDISYYWLLGLLLLIYITYREIYFVKFIIFFHSLTINSRLWRQTIYRQ